MTNAAPPTPVKRERVSAAKALRDLAYRKREGAARSRATAATWEGKSVSAVQTCMNSARRAEAQAAWLLRVAEWLERV